MSFCIPMDHAFGLSLSLVPLLVLFPSKMPEPPCHLLVTHLQILSAVQFYNISTWCSTSSLFTSISLSEFLTP